MYILIGTRTLCRMINVILEGKERFFLRFFICKKGKKQTNEIVQKK